MRYSSFAAPTLLARGDADHSGVADFNDYNAILGAWNKPVGHAEYAASVDLDHSGLIDFNDIGALLTAWGSMDTPGTSAPTARHCSIAYTGALWDPIAQMSLMRKRWHDPNLGRFITRDPAGYVDGMSMYLYCRGNPLIYLDPWGLAAGECTDPQWHHLLPEALEDVFAKADINTNDAEWGWTLPAGEHRKLHPKWNEAWKEWIQQQRADKAQITGDGVREQLKRMASDSKFRDALGTGAQATQRYTQWRKLGTDAKADAFRKARDAVGDSLMKVTGRAIKQGAMEGAQKALGLVGATVFIVVETAQGKAVGDAILDNTLPPGTELLVQASRAGQQAVSDYVDRSRENAMRSMRNRHGDDLHDITKELYPDERQPIK